MAEWIIRPETPEDYRQVESLTRDAFWNVYRPGCLEHYLVHRLRGCKDLVAPLDLVMEKEGRIIGHIMYVRAKIRMDGGGVLPVMTFGPLSIAPDMQRRGYGTALLTHSLALAQARGAKAVCIEGNPAFYGRCGFVSGASKAVRYNNESEEVPYFLVRELRAGYLDGVSGAYHTPDCYRVDEAQAEAFDAAFPPRERLRLPGQLT